MKAGNYGQLIAGVTGETLVSYHEYGSYQGDYLAVTRAGDLFKVWKGGYGSCSGCDFLEGERDYETDEIPDQAAKDYVGQPFLELRAEDVTPDLDIESLLPANSRLDTYSDFSYADVLKQLLEAKAAV